MYIVVPNYTKLLSTAWLKIILRQWVVTMTSQSNFCLVKFHFWPIKIMEKRKLIL